jgi:hypothetical protein
VKAYSGADHQVVIRSQLSEPNLSDTVVEAETDDTEGNGQLGPCFSEEVFASHVRKYRKCSTIREKDRFESNDHSTSNRR